MKNKILVIEDDRAISELLCMNLEAAGYETVAAYDGEEAQRLLLWQEDADLAVVDIMLPGKDGFALMEDCCGFQGKGAETGCRRLYGKTF